MFDIIITVFKNYWRNSFVLDNVLGRKNSYNWRDKNNIKCQKIPFALCVEVVRSQWTLENNEQAMK